MKILIQNSVMQNTYAFLYKYLFFPKLIIASYSFLFNFYKSVNNLIQTLLGVKIFSSGYI